jgi:hypothetical protein
MVPISFCATPEMNTWLTKIMIVKYVKPSAACPDVLSTFFETSLFGIYLSSA